MNELQGDFVTLKPVAPAAVAKVAKAFERPTWSSALHEDKPLPAAKFSEYLFKTHALTLWEVVVDGRAVGFTGYRSNAGYPFIFFCFENDAFDLATAQDCVLPVVHAYFQDGIKHVHPKAVKDPFMVYLPHAQADELEGFLLSNGFDPNENHWWPDYTKMKAYEMLPNTYKAYFQDDGSEESA